MNEKLQITKRGRLSEFLLKPVKKTIKRTYYSGVGLENSVEKKKNSLQRVKTVKEWTTDRI
mgnify:CR=1 FL=1